MFIFQTTKRITQKEAFQYIHLYRASNIYQYIDDMFPFLTTMSMGN
jgi:hypothetical protein